MKEFHKELYDGLIYERKDCRTELGLCLRFKSGSFHFADDLIEQAKAAGFLLVTQEKEYQRMPWGNQHIGYRTIIKTDQNTMFKKAGV